MFRTMGGLLKYLMGFLLPRSRGSIAFCSVESWGNLLQDSLVLVDTGLKSLLQENLKQ